MSEMLLRQGRGAVQSGDSWSLFLLSWTLGTGSQADAKAAEPSDSGPRLQLSECREYIWIKPSAMVTSLLRPCLRGERAMKVRVLGGEIALPTWPCLHAISRTDDSISLD